MKIRHAFAAMMLCGLGIAPSVQAEELTGQMKSIALVQAIEKRGLECGMLTKWQAVSLRAQTMEEARRWTPEQHRAVVEHAEALAQETACDSQRLITWIDAASRGFDSEYLPPYLVMYRTFAQMDARPAVFDSVALRYDYTPAITAIDAHLADLEAMGAVPDGGAEWPVFIDKTSDGAEQLAGIVAGTVEDDRYSADRAAAFIAQSALITELWLEDTLITQDNPGTENND